MKSAWVPLAKMVPLLMSPIELLPIFPDPWIVSWLVSVSVPDAPAMKFCGLAESVKVSVPPPLRVTFDAPMIRLVVLPAEFKEILPALETTLPLTVRLVLSLKFRLSALLTVKPRAWAPPTSNITADTPFPLLISAFVLLVGTPFDQLAELLQTPEAPPTQHVLPPGHWAHATVAEKQSAASKATNALARRIANLPRFLSILTTVLELHMRVRASLRVAGPGIAFVRECLACRKPASRATPQGPALRCALRKPDDLAQSSEARRTCQAS